MHTTLCNETISKSTALHRENPLHLVIIASLFPGMRLVFFTASIPGGGRGKNCYGYDDRKMLSKYAFSLRVLSMILVGCRMMANVLRPMINIKVRFTVQVGRLQPDLQSVFKGLMTKCNNRYWKFLVGHW